MPTNIAQIELSLERELDFDHFGGLENDPSKSTLNAKVTACDPKIFPKIRQDFAKSSKVQNFGSNCHWHAYKITSSLSPITVNLENVKNVTFCQKC